MNEVSQVVDSLEVISGSTGMNMYSVIGKNHDKRVAVTAFCDDAFVAYSIGFRIRCEWLPTEADNIEVLPQTMDIDAATEEFGLPFHASSYDSKMKFHCSTTVGGSIPKMGKLEFIKTIKNLVNDAESPLLKSCEVVETTINKDVTAFLPAGITFTMVAIELFKRTARKFLDMPDLDFTEEFSKSAQVLPFTTNS